MCFFTCIYLTNKMFYEQIYSYNVYVILKSIFHRHIYLIILLKFLYSKKGKWEEVVLRLDHDGNLSLVKDLVFLYVFKNDVNVVQKRNEIILGYANAYNFHKPRLEHWMNENFIMYIPRKFTGNQDYWLCFLSLEQLKYDLFLFFIKYIILNISNFRF